MADNAQDKNTAKNLPYPPGGEKIKYDPQSGMSPSLMAGGSTGPFKDALDQGQEDLKQRGLLQEGQPPGPNNVDMSKVNYSYMSIIDKKNPQKLFSLTSYSVSPQVIDYSDPPVFTLPSGAWQLRTTDSRPLPEFRSNILRFSAMSQQTPPTSTSRRSSTSDPSLPMKDDVMQKSVQTEASNNPCQIPPSLLMGKGSTEATAKMLKDSHDAWRKEPNESKLQHLLDDAMVRSSEISVDYEFVPAVVEGNGGKKP
ncbi:hypothetical protein BGZ58_009158 [Dissophora ornata]|nr:hypothetical protein BGZ58_009158 [Dissophora ornata]